MLELDPQNALMYRLNRKKAIKAAYSANYFPVLIFALGFILLFVYLIITVPSEVFADRPWIPFVLLFGSGLVSAAASIICFYLFLYLFQKLLEDQGAFALAMDALNHKNELKYFNALSALDRTRYIKTIDENIEEIHVVSSLRYKKKRSKEGTLYLVLSLVGLGATVYMNFSDSNSINVAVLTIVFLASISSGAVGIFVLFFSRKEQTPKWIFNRDGIFLVKSKSLVDWSQIVSYTIGDPKGPPLFIVQTTGKEIKLSRGNGTKPELLGVIMLYQDYRLLYNWKQFGTI